RQIYIEQPNRDFVRSLILTEKHIRLMHFDRSGVYLSKDINIHENPIIFIRLILGLTSPNEKDLGLDTSVKWKIDSKTGKKKSGTIKTVDSNGQPITYNLNMKEKVIVRECLRGRGTTCWHATHPKTKEAVFIKDSWRTSTRKPESDYLNAAKGLPGVAQIISYQDYMAETKDYRPEEQQEDELSDFFHNRVKIRVVMEAYGPSIWHFEDRYQLIAAFRDAIAAHGKLLERNVLHRDIAVHNILFCPASTTSGPRSILIDLDMAVWGDRSLDEICKDPRSVRILHYLFYLDDLESFFYALCHIIFAFKRPGVEHRNLPALIQEWKTD
ncbi:hypothetical protein DFP72DRAFT_1092047, partial [Ephemerocybe angulata]